MTTTLTQPKVGIVSLGCPKALVDSERIITRLRAEGYAIAADYKGADLVLVNTCGFLDSARAESLDAIGEAINENGKVIVTGCLGAEANVITERHPGVLAVTGPHQYEQVMSAVHTHLPAPDHPFVSLVPEIGRAPHAAPLRLPEDFRGLQQPLLVLHHPEPARRSGVAPDRCGAARGGAAGEGGREGNPRHHRRTRRLTASM